MKVKKQKSKNGVRVVVNTPCAPKAIGPYSQGIELKKLIFFSGQIAIDPATGALAGNDFPSQTRQVLKNIDALLADRGLTAANVVKTTIFITDMSKFAEVNAEYGNYFNFEPPARSCVAVSALPMGALVEIEVIASLL
ncbi:MAG: Rid family detoxifying hydrolase [Clostridiales bacterium]|nr:Rid family detoxifying hydrolase [Clostridiales bacterium]